MRASDDPHRNMTLFVCLFSYLFSRAASCIYNRGSTKESQEGKSWPGLLRMNALPTLHSGDEASRVTRIILSETWKGRCIISETHTPHTHQPSYTHPHTLSLSTRCSGRQDPCPARDNDKYSTSMELQVSVAHHHHHHLLLSSASDLPRNGLQKTYIPLSIESTKDLHPPTHPDSRQWEREHRQV